MTPNDMKISPIQSFPGYYASDCGYIFSKYRKPQSGQNMFKLKAWLDNCGYYVVKIHNNKNKITKRVHCLVLEAFVGMRPAGMHGCHNNGNKVDNNLSNLRWDTHKNNMADKHIHGTQLFGEKNSAAKLKNTDIPLINELLVNSRMSLKRIGRIFGVSDQAIWKIKHNKKWKRIQGQST